MVSVHPQFITDSAGKKLVVLSISEFNDMIEELEDLDDLRLYDEAKAEDTGERILFSDYLKNRTTNPKKLMKDSYIIP